MATEFYITAENNPQKLSDVSFKDAVKSYSLDFSPWAEDNNTVTAVTWTVKSGQASVSGQALASNVATAQVTFSQEGGSLIQIKAETGTETYILYLDILAKDPDLSTDDYGVFIE